METIGSYYRNKAEVMGALQAWHVERPNVTRFRWMTHYASMEDVVAVLTCPHGHKIRGLVWSPVDPMKDVSEAVPFLAELESLEVSRASAPRSADLFSAVLERPNKLTQISMDEFCGDAPRFFAALQTSRVTSLEVGFRICCSPAFFNGFKAFLQQDRLVSFSQTQSNYSKRGLERALDVDEILAACVHLEELEYQGRVPSVVSKSVKKLTLESVVPHPRGSPILEIPDVRDLVLIKSGAVPIVASNLETLKVYVQDCAVNPLLVDISRLRVLDVNETRLDRSTIKKIAAAIVCGNLRVLRLPVDSYYGPFEDMLEPSLKHPNCALERIDFSRAHHGIPRSVQKFHARVCMFALLLARKPHKVLARLPYEHFRMVGAMLV